MKKLDLKKQLKAFYLPTAKAVSEVDLPAFNYLMVDGQGDPSTAPAFAKAVEALYSVSYALKFALKRGPAAIDYGVMPLEGLWWADDMGAFSTKKRHLWKWTLMIMQPDFVEAAQVKEARAQVSAKKGLPAVKDLRFESLNEGRCAQIMHIGPFATEGPTIQKLHDHIAAQGGRLRGKHHEIYLSDMRRVDASKWKTVIRQPAKY